MATTRYVGIGGNDSNDGLSWANRKLTLNGVENTPVEAGDTVYVGAGTYREQLTLDVSGTSGSPITYTGDVDGSHTDGVGGVVRITGLAADCKSTNNAGITGNSRSFRTFNNLMIDHSTGAGFYCNGTFSDIIINKCLFVMNNGNGPMVYFIDNVGNVTISNCVFILGYKGGTNHCVYLIPTNEVNDKTCNITNCIFEGGAYAVYSVRYGNVSIKNCTIRGGVRTNLVNTSYPMTVTNCIIHSAGTAFTSSALGSLVEDYNNVFGVDIARSNVAVGANTLTYPIQFDYRWASEMLWFGGKMITPHDLLATSALIDVAGTSPTTADLRGTTVQGTQRELGALEYDSTLDVEAGTGGGGAVSIQPVSGRLGL